MPGVTQTNKTRKKQGKQRRRIAASQMESRAAISVTPEKSPSVCDDPFKLVFVPRNLLVNIFRKATALERVRSAQTCKFIYEFLIDSQKNYRQFGPPLKWNQPEAKIVLKNGLITVSLRHAQETTPETVFPLSEAYLIREHTFEAHPGELAIYVDQDVQELIDVMRPLLNKCICLKINEIPDQMTGLKIAAHAKEARILRFNAPTTVPFLAQHFKQNPTICSLWLSKNCSLRGDAVLDYFMDTKKSMKKIVMVGGTISAKQFFTFITESVYQRDHLLVTADIMTTTSEDRKNFRVEYGITIDFHTRTYTIKPFDYNIIFQVSTLVLT